MWALLVDSAGSSILELSIRAIVGAVVALFILLLLASVFRRNEEIKQYAFVLALAIILLTSMILFMTALAHMQETVFSLTREVTTS